MRLRTIAFCAAALLVLAGCGDDHHETSASAPQPVDAATATRTVDISAGPGFLFVPAAVDVKKGETVAFKVVNSDHMGHEFVVGDAAAQDHHEEEMKELKPGETMTEEPGEIIVNPGETQTVAFTFPTAGTFFYGCHVPGHYPAGMKGEIKVT